MSKMLSPIAGAALALAVVGTPIEAPAQQVETLHAASVSKSRHFHPKRHRVVRKAKSRVGTPYLYGATGPRRFDCSGLVQWSFRQTGMTLPRSSSSQARIGRRTNLRNLRKGDLVKWPGHVALYVGNGRVVEAAKPGTTVRVRKLRPSSGFDSLAHGRRLNYLALD